MSSVSLFLLGQKGFASLKAILEKDTNHKSFIKVVVIGSDKGVENDYAEEIESLCIQTKIPFNRDYREAKCDTEFAMAIGWRWLIDTTNTKLIVIHDSLLPKYRGFNPLVTALIEGDTEIGATALLANHEMDAGNIIGQQKLIITYPIKIQNAIQRVCELYSGLASEAFKKIVAGNLHGVKQNDADASYSLWRNDEDYFIDWTDSADRIKRIIDSVGSPYAGAATHYKGQIIRVAESRVMPDKKIINRVAGKILSIESNKPVVVCGSGLLQIEAATDDDSKSITIFDRLREKLK